MNLEIHNLQKALIKSVSVAILLNSIGWHNKKHKEWEWILLKAARYFKKNANKRIKLYYYTEASDASTETTLPTS